MDLVWSWSRPQRFGTAAVRLAVPAVLATLGWVAPLIGISGYVELARWGPWDRESTVLPQAYVTAVHAVGGRAVVIPPFPEHAADLVARLDGLILAGGSDLDPALYGAEPDPRTTGVRPARDAGEVALLRAAIEADLPTLGVCRGMQLMSACAGGKLVQHLESEAHRGVQPGVYIRHEISTVPGTRLAGIIGERSEVPSYHHQGVADPGTLTVSAYAFDGGIEGVEDPSARFRVGVLWHPEQGTDPRLFEALLAA
jgi:putative glutamine amidotransferase